VRDLLYSLHEESKDCEQEFLMHLTRKLFSIRKWRN